jgi:hypothetical protein
VVEFTKLNTRSTVGVRPDERKMTNCRAGPDLHHSDLIAGRCLKFTLWRQTSRRASMLRPAFDFKTQVPCSGCSPDPFFELTTAESCPSVSRWNAVLEHSTGRNRWRPVAYSPVSSKVAAFARQSLHTIL